jgi:hypothetical protein
MKLSPLAYHADEVGHEKPSLSNSMAKLILDKSPYHAWFNHPRLGGHRPEPSKVLDDGSAAHAVLFGMEHELMVLPFDDYKTKLAQGAKQEAYLAEKIPVLEHRYAELQEMTALARLFLESNEELGGIRLADGAAEETLAWMEGEVVPCRSRLDWISADRTLIIDYKTTKASAKPAVWSKQMFSLSYDLQARFYQRANEMTGGPPLARFVDFVQENTEPYACALASLDPAGWAFAEDRRKEALAIWGRCLKTGIWPCYSPRIHYLSPPVWAQMAWAERVALDGYGEEEESE